MLKVLLLGLLLTGSVDNQLGRIGIRVNSSSHGINHVYNHSPAANFGLEPGDIVLEADGHKGHQFVDGIPNTTAHLRIKRGNFIFNIDIPRVPVREIYDEEKPVRIVKPVDC